MVVKRYTEIKTDAENYLKANQNDITDFTEGSMVSTLIESFSRIIEGLYIDTRNGFTSMLKAIVYSIFSFDVKQGVKASGKVKFKRTSAINRVTEIPLNTKVMAGEQIYLTKETATIQSGATESNEVVVEAEETGSKYNAAIGSIDAISSIVPSDIAEVTNTTKIIGGEDPESESETFGRFVDYINGLQGITTYGIKSTVLQNENVKDCLILEHFPPVNNCNFSIIIDSGTGVITDELKNNIRKVIDGDDGTPGKRAIGIQYDIQAAQIRNVDIHYKVSVYQNDISYESEIETVIEKTINSLKIGEPVLLSTIISHVKNLTFVKDITITSPTENIEIDNNYVAKFHSAIRED